MNGGVALAIWSMYSAFDVKRPVFGCHPADNRSFA